MVDTMRTQRVLWVVLLLLIFLSATQAQNRGGSESDCDEWITAFSTPRRNTTIYIIKTTPAQDAAALAYLKAQGKCDRKLPITFGNCASISNGALTAADIFSLPSVDSVTGEPGVPSDFVPGTAGLRATAAGATSVSAPQNSPTVPGGLEGFEPK
jgi:hypothetical protein